MILHLYKKNKLNKNNIRKATFNLSKIHKWLIITFIKKFQILREYLSCLIIGRHTSQLKCKVRCGLKGVSVKPIRHDGNPTRWISTVKTIFLWLWSILFIAKAPSLLFVIRFCILIPMHFSDNSGLRKTGILYVIEYKSNISYKTLIFRKGECAYFLQL